MFNYPPGATPLDLNEAEGLIPKHIITQQQLNEWEQANILDAENWVTRQNFKLTNIATTNFTKKLHQRMFGNTWSWAGQFRKSNKNIGIDWLLIPVQLKILMDDLVYQITQKTYSIDELAARFHYRLVAIHPFANGNGRHARLFADIILLSQGYDRFSWGKNLNLINPSPTRSKYIKALRAADKKNYELLLSFVRE